MSAKTEMDLTSNDFRLQVDKAIRRYDLHVVAIYKSTPDFMAALASLLPKAIEQFKTRPPGMKHGVALDSLVTVIISENGKQKPKCSIYFNLHSDYFEERPKEKEVK